MQPIAEVAGHEPVAASLAHPGAACSGTELIRSVAVILSAATAAIGLRSIPVIARLLP